MNANPPAAPLLSLVVPLYNEIAVAGQLHAEILRVIAGLPYRFQIIYVDDGSRDGTLECMVEFARQDRRVQVVQLSRNWGHQAAISAGLSVAQGAAVVLMDGDLQDPPAVIPEMIAKWNGGAKVVIAQHLTRKESGGRRFLFRAFYRVFSYLSDFPIPANAGIFALMDRQVCDAMLTLKETNRYIPGLRAWVGFPQAVVFHERPARAGGKPKQTLFRLFRYALDAVFSFSYKPLRLALVLGLATAVFSIVGAAVVLWGRLEGIGFFGNPVVAGYSSIMISVLLIGSVQLICLGILGEYIGRVYDEVKGRPLFLIQKIHQADPTAQHTSPLDNRDEQPYI